MESFEASREGLTWRGDGETLLVEAWGEDSIRVRAVMLGEIVETGYALLPAAPTEPEIHIEGARARITNGAITAELVETSAQHDLTGRMKYRCQIAFFDRHGQLLFKEIDTGGSLNLEPRAFRPERGGDHHITASFSAPEDERLYGMGQYQQHILDIKGCTFELAQRNSQASIPFVLSSHGYGFFWHNPAVGRATFAENRTEWVAESALQLDYWVTAGDTPSRIAKAYADATGHVPMMPEYGLGFWQSKLRYWNQEQLLEVAREHMRRGLPLDVIVADFFHWPKLGDFRFEEEFWPDPEAMVRELREMGVELMVSVWPQISLESENYAALAKRNLLVKSERGVDVQMMFQGPSVFLDVTNPRAREFVWQRCKESYFDIGVRLFWLDEAEPEFGAYDFDAYRYHLGPTLRVANIYPQLYARGFYEGQRESGQDEVVNLVRCAWAGSQRYGALVWSGDIHSTFEDLRAQITAGIHMGVAGIPWFATDIGGFHLGHVGDPAFQELFVRWFQFGTFCPVMRLHGDRLPYEEVSTADGEPRLRSGGPNELWSFGEETYEILARYVRVREALRPYSRRAMEEAHVAGQPVMRGLFHEFPADENAWGVDDQFLFGRDILVAPVVTPGAVTRRVYLPGGERWLEVSTGVWHEGGQWIEADAPLDEIPLFTRDGRIHEMIRAGLQRS